MDRLGSVCDCNICADNQPLRTCKWTLCCRSAMGREEEETAEGPVASIWLLSVVYLSFCVRSVVSSSPDGVGGSTKSAIHATTSLNESDGERQSVSVVSVNI